MGALANERFQTGNHVLLFARDTPGSPPGSQRQLLGKGQIGRLPEGTSIDMGINTGARPVHVVGDAEPQDIVDGPHTFEVTLSMIRLRDRGAADRINAGPIDIDEIDRFNENLIQTAEECHLVGARVTVQANQLLAQNLTFQAMRVTGGSAAA